MMRPQHVNYLPYTSSAKFFIWNIEMFIGIISFPHTDMTQVAEIIPRAR